MCNLGEALYERAEKAGMERGIERGMEQGIEHKLVELITAKFKKGMAVPEIADMLEEEESHIRKLIEKYGL